MALASGVFDFFDGLAARLLQVNSAIGKELDSLADVVSFGFLPGAIMFSMLASTTDAGAYVPYLGFLITVFSALRLAKFNVDERQSENFIGLNTPMNTFLIVSLPFIGKDFPETIYNPIVLSGIIVVTSYLLVSEVKLFSLKFSDLSWEANKFKFIFLIISGILICFVNFAAVPVILILYILFSYLHFKRTT